EDKDTDSNERNFAGFFSEDLHNLEGSYGYSSRDIRWRLGTNVTYERPITKAVTLLTSASYSYRTGLPFNALVGADVNKDGDNSTDRPTVAGDHFDKNIFRQPDFSTFD